MFSYTVQLFVFSDREPVSDAGFYEDNKPFSIIIVNLKKALLTVEESHNEKLEIDNKVFFNSKKLLYILELFRFKLQHGRGIFDKSFIILFFL